MAAGTEDGRRTRRLGAARSSAMAGITGDLCGRGRAFFVPVRHG